MPPSKYGDSEQVTSFFLSPKAQTDIYSRLVDSLDLIQIIDMKRRYPFSITISELPDSPCKYRWQHASLSLILFVFSALILAIGSTDRSIQIYTQSEGKVRLVRV